MALKARNEVECDPLTDERVTLVRLQRSAFVVALLAAVFTAGLLVTTREPAIAATNPAATDPYAAIGSFAAQAALLMAAWSLVSAMRTPPEALTSPRVCAMVRRQFLVVAAVTVAIATASVALLRHSDQWIREPAGSDLVGGLITLAALATAVGWVVLRGARGCVAWSGFGQLARGIASLVAVDIALAVYPEGVRHSVFGAVALVLAGAVLLFVPMAEIALAFVPYSLNRYAEAMELPPWLEPDGMQRVVLISAGLGAAGFIAIAEALAVGGGSLRVSQVALFIGVEIFAATIALAMLRGPLGMQHPR